MNVTVHTWKVSFALHPIVECSLDQCFIILPRHLLIRKKFLRETYNNNKAQNHFSKTALKLKPWLFYTTVRCFWRMVSFLLLFCLVADL